MKKIFMQQKKKISFRREAITAYRSLHKLAQLPRLHFSCELAIGPRATSGLSRSSSQPLLYTVVRSMVLSYPSFVKSVSILLHTLRSFVPGTRQFSVYF